jgi:hypothetical protein
MGHLGRSRTFAVVDESATIPSDLEGVVTDRFRPRADDNHRAAVGAACDRIVKIVRELGVSDRKVGQRISEISHRQDAMDSQVRILRLLAMGLITDPEKAHMRGLAGGDPYDVRFHHDMMAELKHLDALRYVQPRAGKGLNHIYERDGKSEHFDLKQYVYLTEAGREYVRLLDELSTTRSEFDGAAEASR